MHMTPEKVHNTLGKYMLADGMSLVYEPGKSKGSYLHDGRSGKDFLDLFSFFASMPLGHNHPKLTSPEFTEYLGQIAAVKPSNADIYTTAMAEFVQRFATTTTESFFKYLFFVSGGALAVENTLKAAFDWRVRKLGLEGKEDVNNLEIIHFKEAFHGRSGYTMSLTNTADPRKYQFFPKFDWPRIVNPKRTFPDTDRHRQTTLQLEEQATNEILDILKTKPERIAAIIIEPIQGEGGDNHFRKEFLQTLRKIADEHDILLIFDEVQTGMGLTGTYWAFEQYCVVPDLIAFGKKTQICGIAATKRFDEVENHVFKLSSRINSTWGGNLVDMVRCSKYLQIIEEDRLLDHTKQVGSHFLQNLSTLQTNFSDLISNTRGLGLMIAFDLPSAGLRDRCISELYNREVLALPCGAQSVRFRPHLDVSQDALDTATNKLEDVFKQLQQT